MKLMHAKMVISIMDANFDINNCIMKFGLRFNRLVNLQIKLIHNPYILCRTTSSFWPVKLIFYYQWEMRHNVYK